MVIWDKKSKVKKNYQTYLNYSINVITNTGCIGCYLVTSLSANGEKSLPKKITGMSEDEKLIFVNVTNKNIDGKDIIKVDL